MNSNSVKNIKEAYIWIWLPSSVEPIVCGKLEKHKGKYYFVYGKSYLSNKNAISLSPVELELSETVYAPVGINNIHPV